MLTGRMLDAEAMILPIAPAHETVTCPVCGKSIALA